MKNQAGPLRLDSGKAAVALMAFLLSQGTSLAASPRYNTDGCLECHDQSTETITFKDGTKKSVGVDTKTWMSSVHGGKLDCTDCHREITGYPHAKTRYKNARDSTIQRAGTCQRCHYAYYTRVLDSIHYEVLKAGDDSAPTCVDCHGSHAIKNPKTPRLAVNAACAKCHAAVNKAYQQSAHGRALLTEGNVDVPLCTDCHGSHAVVAPSTPEFKLSSYSLCAKCHSDTKRMKPYGLNPEVTTTYLEDFHGASNRIYATSTGSPKKPIATCADCHGVHDIKSFKAVAATETRKDAQERVVKSCRKCHEAVPAAFADAWLSHYEPSLKTAPLVWIVKWVYRIMIPFIMVGLVLHILLHLWRVRTHR